MFNNRVLAVDDDPNLLWSYQEILGSDDSKGEEEDLRDPFSRMEEEDSSSGRMTNDAFKVTTAKNGQEGVACVEQALLEDCPFAVAFVDMRMPPGIDGLETAKAIRELDDRIYVVIVTAYTDRTIDELQEAVQHDILLVRKPFVSEEIYQLARNFCISWERDKKLSDTQHALSELNATLEQQVKDRTEDLRVALEKKEVLLQNIIDAMMKLVALKKPSLITYQRNVARLAPAMAKEMGMDDESVKAVEVAGKMHALGLIGIPYRFFSKFNLLAGDEAKVFRKYPEIGYQVLSAIDFPWPVAGTVLQHQERLDGSGFPGRLKGDAVMTEARIVGVAQIVASIVSDHLHDPELGLEAALDLLMDEKGISLDDNAVEACLKLFQEKGSVLMEMDG